MLEEEKLNDVDFISQNWHPIDVNSPLILKFHGTEETGYKLVLTDFQICWYCITDKDEMLELNRKLNPDLKISKSFLIEILQKVLYGRMEYSYFNVSILQTETKNEYENISSDKHASKSTSNKSDLTNLQTEKIESENLDLKATSQFSYSDIQNFQFLSKASIKLSFKCKLDDIFQFFWECQLFPHPSPRNFLNSHLYTPLIYILPILRQISNMGWEFLNNKPGAILEILGGLEKPNDSPNSPINNNFCNLTDGLIERLFKKSVRMEAHESSGTFHPLTQNSPLNCEPNAFSSWGRGIIEVLWPQAIRKKVPNTSKSTRKRKFPTRLSF